MTTLRHKNAHQISLRTSSRWSDSMQKIKAPLKVAPLIVVLLSEFNAFVWCKQIDISDANKVET